jgi:hypothetical protein
MFEVTGRMSMILEFGVETVSLRELSGWVKGVVVTGT